MKLIKMTDALNERQISAINEAHLYAWSQTRILFLFMSYVSDLTNNRVKIQDRTIKLYGYLIHDILIKEAIEQVINKGPELEMYFFATAKNFFRGTTKPIYEICQDPIVKDLICKIFFIDKDHFKSFHGISSIIRHFLSHNYTTKVVLKKWDVEGTDLQSLRRDFGNKVEFQYVGKKLFPEVYKDSDFQINISIDLSIIKAGTSLFDAIEITQLLFLGELCNNCLTKLNQMAMANVKS